MSRCNSLEALCRYPEHRDVMLSHTYLGLCTKYSDYELARCFIPRPSESEAPWVHDLAVESWLDFELVSPGQRCYHVLQACSRSSQRSGCLVFSGSSHIQV